MKPSFRAAALLFLLAFCRHAYAAKTVSRHSGKEEQQHSRSHHRGDRLFTIFHQQACVGIPYTKNTSTLCDGWSDLTEEECEQKCAQNEKAPNCVKDEPCHAAVYFPASKRCQLFKNCETLEPSIGSVTLLDQEMTKKEQAEEKLVKEEVGNEKPFEMEELMTSMPLVLMNLTNISTLLRNSQGHTKSPGITHIFGNITADRELLYDKVYGFLLVLHEKMNDGDGPKYCGFRDEASIAECITIATCLIQTAVCKDVSMQAFAALMEQVARFEEITWPLLKTALIGEGDEVADDPSMPDLYRCDGVHEADPRSLATPALLQVEATRASEAEAETLATSSALRQAMAQTHHILDSHASNASMHHTAQRLETLWHPICRKLYCDHTNMHDVFLASHRQTMALFQTKAVGHLHMEIRQRVKMDIRMQSFIAEHYMHDVHFHHDNALPSSKEAVVVYGKRGREAMLGLVVPFVSKISKLDVERAVRLVDHVELAKFAEEQEKKERLERAGRKLKMSHAAGTALLEEASEVVYEEEDEDYNAEEDADAARLGLAAEDAEERRQQEEKHRARIAEEKKTAANSSAAHWCVGSTVALWSHHFQHYIRMSDDSRNLIEASHQGYQSEFPYAWTWERFKCVDLGHGEVGFHSPTFNRFMRMGGHMDRSWPIDADKLPGNWPLVRFRLKDMGGGYWALWNPTQRKFVKMASAGLVTSPTLGINDLPSHWESEKFFIQPVPEAPAANQFWFCDKTVSIWSHTYQHYVSMHRYRVEKGPHGWRGTFPEDWDLERFVPVMAGHGEVAFHNSNWNSFLRMDENGIMDRGDVVDRDKLTESMSWERFKVVDTGKPNYIALYNQHFKKFVKMDWNHQDLITSGVTNWWTLPTDWSSEQFYLQEVGEGGKCRTFWCRLRKGLEKAINKIADFVAKLLECFGQWSFSQAVGYNRDLGANIGLSFGVSGGVSFANIIKLIRDGEVPSASISLDMGLGAGGTAKFLWTGVGVGLSLSCGGGTEGSCSFGVSVGAVFTAWAMALADARCVFGPTLAGAFDCSRSAGGTFLLVCCSYDITNGKNNCR